MLGTCRLISSAHKKTYKCKRYCILGEFFEELKVILTVFDRKFRNDSGL